MRKSGKEKTIVEPMILGWALVHRFDLSVVDTSAVYNRRAKCFLSSQASESLCDLIGNRGSLSVWIELKAPKMRRSILQSPHQIAFLKRKIDAGAFACVTDSVEHINALWTAYCSLKTNTERIELLLNDLPQKRVASLRQQSGRSKSNVGL